MFDDENDEIDPKELPIYKKGVEIFEVVDQICQLIDDDDQYLCHIKGIMLEDAMLLTVKVAGAEGGQLYDIRMECAAIIRKAARELMVQNHSLEMFGFEHVEYFQIIRDLLEEYRLLFIDWVAGFEKWDYIIDRWGLFNPPSIGPFDHDPDDDVPFNGFDEN
ncbi:hypothetical protein AQPE_0422 [Aquipluma nitroreducens]|uniref:Uncharacterized protein n=1 Tax=Aquipluma nitroreducens TaxID=2010828 RepID=A0A5K7S483_9BACT|nr:hypothetical protein [Aquipluma nitroreducens]BBE16285.1 hypothetical protein AQPE_0422 [Aquipluma nitroreducens]